MTLPTGPYSTLLDTIGEQRERIAFFERVVFHAHSIDSRDWAQRANADAQRNDAARLGTEAGIDEFLDELARHHSVVCITDHMRCTYATRLARAALERNDITVLPGMEINCLPAPHYADAIHVLAVFPPEAGEVAIERIFAGKSLVEPAERTGKETVRFDDLRDLRTRIDQVGGIFVLAHVENEKRGHRARFRIDRAKTLAMYTEGEQLELDLADEYGVYLAKLQPDAEIYPDVVDGLENEGGVPSRLMKTDAGYGRQEGTPCRMFAGSPSRGTMRSRSRSMSSLVRVLAG